MVLRREASFDLARRLRTPEGAPLGDVFSFLSGLYFRGKLAYAREFARPPEGAPGGVFIITAGAGLWPADDFVTLAHLRRFARVAIDAAEPRYRRPLARASQELARRADGSEIVLLGSIASGKYVDILGKIFGERLVFPSDFVGRGDMSRGGLMLRCVREGRELDYAPVLTAVRHGSRPPKLPRL
jgi:hypothetical protein